MKSAQTKGSVNATSAFVTQAIVENIVATVRTVQGNVWITNLAYSVKPSRLENILQRLARVIVLSSMLLKYQN